MDDNGALWGPLERQPGQRCGGERREGQSLVSRHLVNRQPLTVDVVMQMTRLRWQG
jgi:hypothetical protein